MNNNTPNKKPNTWHGFLGLFYTMVGWSGFIILQHILYKFNIELNTTYFLILQLIWINLSLILAILFTVRSQNLSFKNVTFFKSAPFGTILLTLMGIIALGLLSDQLVSFLHQSFPDIYTPNHLLYLVNIFQKASLPQFLLLSLCISLLPALGEELMFRGFLLLCFKNSFKTWGALIITSLLFGLIHLNWIQSTAACLFGLYLGFVTISTKSLLPVIIGHFVNNLLWCINARFNQEALSKAMTHGHDIKNISISAVIFVTVIIVFIKIKNRVYSS